MRYSALMQDERREGYIEVSQSFLLKVLAAKGSITEKSKEKIKNEMDPNIWSSGLMLQSIVRIQKILPKLLN